MAIEILGLQYQVAIGRVAVRRPLPHKVGDGQVGVTREGITGLLVFITMGMSAAAAINVIHPHLRQPGLPAVTAADITAELGKQSLDVPQCVRGLSPRKTRATKGFTAEAQIQVGGRHPAELHTVVGVLAAEHGAVHQRLIPEVPGVRVHPVQVADVRIEAPEAQAGAGRQGERIDEGLLDLDLGAIAVIVQPDGTSSIKQLIDRGRHHQLGLVQRQTLGGQTRLSAQLKPRQGIVVRVL